jgi:carbon-monoxide dehydrogenase large subunit
VSSLRFVGRSLTSESQLTLVRGEGSYVDDIYLPDMLYAAFVRSTYAHAEIKSIQRNGNGIMEIITNEDIRAICQPIETIEPLSHPNLYVQTYPWYPLPLDKVRYVGQPVAAIAAESRYAAADAVGSVQVEYEPLQTVVRAEDSLLPGAPKLYDTWKDNVMLRFRLEGGDVDKAFGSSDHIVETTLRMHRQTTAPIENRACLAQYDRRLSFLTLWTTTQVPHVWRTFLSSILGIPENNIRVIQPHVGGSFGRGHPTYPEDILVCLLAMRTGRPVKWVGTRMECLMTDHHAREQIHHVRAGFRKDGRLLAIDDKAIADMGVFQPSSGLASCLATIKMIPGPYKIGNYRTELICAATNKSTFGAYRGFGKETSTLVHERIMDLAAEELGIDLAAIRFRNFITPEDFPYVSVSGERYDIGNYHKCLRKVLEMIDYENIRAQQIEARRRHRLLGVGMAYYLCPGSPSNTNNLYTGWDSATITMDPSGSVTIFTGLASPGTQHDSTFAQVAADELGIDPASIKVIEGDTQLCPYGLGSWADRGATIGASAVLTVARRLRQKIARIASNLLQTHPEELEFKDGMVHSRNKSIKMREIAWIAYASPNKLPIGEEPGLLETGTYTFKPEEIKPNGLWSMYPVFSNGAAAAVVEVDPETFEVTVRKFVLADDSGLVINPAVVEGQLIGAAIQGISGTFLEEIIYNEDGQLLTASLMDYQLASAVETPTIALAHMEIPSPMTPLGTKGVGESGITPAYAALCSAVEDALRPYGIRITETSITSEKLWRLASGKSVTRIVL